MRPGIGGALSGLVLLIASAVVFVLALLAQVVVEVLAVAWDAVGGLGELTRKGKR